VVLPFWRTMGQRVQVLRDVILPSSVVIGLVIGVRLIGWLQVHEWMAFDQSSRLCQTKPHDAAVVIVGIDEADLEQVGGYPVSDRILAQALQILSDAKPSVIGLDLFRNLPVEPGHEELKKILPVIPNLVGIEVVLNADSALNVAPPPGLPAERIGFADMMVDSDGKLRRALLASPTWQGDVRYALPLRLAQLHLAARGIQFKHGARSRDLLRFGSVELPRFQPNAGGYIRADANGNQLILNFCASGEMLRVLTLRDVLQQNFSPEWIRDRVVVIGMTASSVKDVFFTDALRETVLSRRATLQTPANQLVYGMEVHAQTAHQIISSALHQQPLIQVWAEGWEYGWIVLWGGLGVIVSIVLQSPWKSILGVAIAAITLVGLSFWLLMSIGLWLPIVPTVLSFCGAGLVTAFFDRDLRFELAQRRRTIEQTYDAVHNGPLQQLAVILRSRDLSPDQVEMQLRSLNEELRNIFERMRHEVSTRSEQLYLRGNLVLDLKAPVPELLYQVYNHTRGEDLPGFEAIRTFIPPNFEPLRSSCHSLEDKRGLCLFLQEALFNAGKHAIGATRLDIVCSAEAGWYRLQIIDNAPGLLEQGEGQGTRQARAIAYQLRGRFDRYSHLPEGTICELTWRRRKQWLRKIRTRFRW
jgi:CHASE2 domain-containing sensor protein